MRSLHLRAVVLALAIGAVALPAAADNFSVVVRNGLYDAITSVYISKAESRDWGEDLLRGRTIMPNMRAEVPVANSSPSCVYDVRVDWIRDSDGATGQQVFQYIDCNLRDITVR
jgi:hypothetical protein